MNKETVHPTIGSKVRLINKPIWVGAYEEGETGVVIERDVFGDAAPHGYILVALDRGVDYTYNIPHGEYEVIQDVECKGTPQDILNAANTVLSVNSVGEASAESLRNVILSIREQRESLRKEMEQLDEQEKEAVEKLKEKGFALIEPFVLAEPTDSTEKKSVLYAEDIEEDMTNPENWEVGDFVEVCSGDSIYCKFGDVFEVSGFDGSWIKVLKDSKGRENSINPVVLKFHSRPVVK